MERKICNVGSNWFTLVPPSSLSHRWCFWFQIGVSDSLKNSQRGGYLQLAYLCPHWATGGATLLCCLSNGCLQLRKEGVEMEQSVPGAAESSNSKHNQYRKRSICCNHIKDNGCNAPISVVGSINILDIIRANLLFNQYLGYYPCQSFGQSISGILSLPIFWSSKSKEKTTFAITLHFAQQVYSRKCPSIYLS